MGKHERDWVEAAEQSVADGLNGQPTNSYIEQIVSAIKNKIGVVYQKALWVGGDNYKDPGDVHIISNDKKIKIELKFSKATGNGTAKNVSAKIFNKKVSNTIKGYQQFDIDLGLREQRYKLVESKINRTLRNASDYTKCLRSFRDTGDVIIEQIAEITSPGQEQYAKYAADLLNQHLEKVNFVVNEILGTSQIDENHQDVLYCVIKNFESSTQTVEFFDFTDLDKFITHVESSGKSIKLYNKSNKDVIRFSVTWKNICQGGATPCFNVFVGNAFRN